MKKKLMFLAVAALFLGGGVLTAMQLTKKEKVSGLTLVNIEAMTFDTIDMNGQRDNPSGCSTSRSVEVQVIIDGKIQTIVKTETVRGMENTCRRDKSSSCNAFACTAAQ